MTVNVAVVSMHPSKAVDYSPWRRSDLHEDVVQGASFERKAYPKPIRSQIISERSPVGINGRADLKTGWESELQFSSSKQAQTAVS